MTPYLYDPSQGNLLFDAIAWQGESPSHRGDLVPGILTGLGGSPFATQGGRQAASIFQFTFVPVTPGDYNRDGTVDAADYVVWRRGLGTTYTQTDYDAWRANFGQTIGSGAALPSAEPLSVIPEPSTALMVFVGSLALAARCRPTHVRLRRKIERKKMTNWQAWMACGLLMSLPAAAQADIFRWDNGQLIPGTEGITPGPGVNLSSSMGEWRSPERNLRFADFSGGLDLTEARFYNSWLDNSRFNGANLTRASLEAAMLTNADLSETNLTGAFLWFATLNGANFTNAEVRQANFYRVSSYGHSGITPVQLYSTASYQAHDLTGIGLGNNDLTGANLANQNLTNANFSTYYTEQTGANLTGANLSQSNLTTADFRYATLTNADLSGTNLTDASFSNATLTNANLSGAVVTGARFEGNTSFGFTKEQLYSTASYQQKNLRGIQLGGDLTSWDFNGQDLSGASLVGSTLTSANFAGAVVTGADFRCCGGYFEGPGGSGITLPQLYSTASYQQKNLRGIGLGGSDLSGGDFSGQDLTGAYFGSLRLTNANFSFADLRGAQMPSGPSQLTRNTIREFGAINGLDLDAGETLVVRDSDIGITVNHSMNAVSGGTLELVLGDADWGSTMAVAAGITPDLGGTLRVRFADQASLASMLGTTFDFFDWPGVLETNNRFDAIELPPGTQWDFSQLYVTGTAQLTAIPEPSAVLLFACGTAACAVARLRILANRRIDTNSTRTQCAPDFAPA